MDEVNFLNIAGYYFVAIDDAANLRGELQSYAKQFDLKGTVIIASEGINLVLAGSEEGIRSWLAFLRSDARFVDIVAKESWSSAVPFQRLKVKVKQEIIRMDHPTVRPADQRASTVGPETLKRWLDQRHDDQNRAILLLDTRNEFEVATGTFVGSVSWKIAKFSEFPPAALEHKSTLEGMRVVSFCTGGIRCEKAALFLQDAGVENVVQLDGGILKYFEEVGQDHFVGSCFVFDERIALTDQLNPIST